MLGVLTAENQQLRSNGDLPEFGIYVRVVGKLQIEQSKLW